MSIAVTDTGTKPDQPVSAQLRGETIGYAVQSIGYNLIGNIFEPYISYKVQERFSGPDATHHGPHGTYTQNFVGEYAGDFAGSTALILAESVAPDALHSFTRKLRSMVDPLYDKIARIFIKKDCPDTEYEKKITEWKTFQERNLIRTGLIDTIGIAANVATQKWILENPSPTKLVFAGKLASTAVVSGIELGARFMMPKKMNSIDKWMGNVIAPLVKDDQEHKASADAGKPTPGAHTDKLVKQRQRNQQSQASGLISA